jgi:hypothetical protein
VQPTARLFPIVFFQDFVALLWILDESRRLGEITVVDRRPARGMLIDKHREHPLEILLELFMVRDPERGSETAWVAIPVVIHSRETVESGYARNGASCGHM